MTEKTLVLEEKIARLLKLSREAISLSSDIFREFVAPQKVIQQFQEIFDGIRLATKILKGEKIDLPKEFPEKKKIEVE